MLEFFRTLFSPPRDLILPMLAAWLGLTLAERRAERHAIGKEDLNTLVFYALITFVLAGRIAYALANFPAFVESPLSLLSPNPDLFDVTGACVGAALAGFIVCRRRKLPVLNSLDALAPFFAVLAIGIGFQHLAAGTAFGQPTRVPWAIHLWSADRHPSQIYEILFGLAVLLFIWTSKIRFRAGVLFLLFAALTAGGRLFLEAFRGDSTLLPGGFRQAQVVAWIILSLCFILIEVVGNKHAPDPSVMHE